MGVEVRVNGLAKSYGRRTLWTDVSFTLPAGEISTLVGPSGTGKSLLLKMLVGLARPDRGGIVLCGRDITRLSERELYRVRRGFGVLFSDGGLFSSMTVFENVAFPLREHTRRSEREIAATVRQKLDMVGALGAERLMPADLPAGTRKRAALARAMVLDPQIVLIDEPEAGLDPVRSAHLHQLIVDLNQHTGITFLLASHDIQAVRTVPDNIGLLYGGKLAMFGPREMLLSSHDPVIRQFLTAHPCGPIGLAEHGLAHGQTLVARTPLPPIALQLAPSDGRPRAAQRPPGEWLQMHGVAAPAGSFLPLGAVPGREPAPTLSLRAAPHAMTVAVTDDPTVELPRLTRSPRALARERAAAQRAALRRARPAGDAAVLSAEQVAHARTALGESR